MMSIHKLAMFAALASMGMPKSNPFSTFDSNLLGKPITEGEKKMFTGQPGKLNKKQKAKLKSKA